MRYAVVTILPLVDVPTDFNSITSGGLVKASKRFVRTAWYDLTPGAVVRLIDADGNSCLGRIEQAEGLSLRVMPAWSTWQAGPVHVELAYAFQLAPPVLSPETVSVGDLSLTA